MNVEDLYITTWNDIKKHILKWLKQVLESVSYDLIVERKGSIYL